MISRSPHPTRSVPITSLHAAVLLVALVHGCVDDDEDELAMQDEVFTNPAWDGALHSPEDIGFRLGANPATYWSGNPVMIPVCWENDTPDATARAWVREAIESSWSRFARVNFTGWGWCSAGAPGVHVRNLEQAINAGELPWDAPSNANAYGATSIGRFLDGFDDGVTLAFCNGVADRQSCVKGIAIHEFGHVLGFHHAEERLDYDGPLCNNPADANGNPLYPAPVSYGAYDLASVMSYCGGSGPRLSAGDIAGVQRAYGRRSSGTLMSPRAKCLSNNAFNPGNPGQESFIWDCWEDFDNQEWRYRPVNGELRIRPGSPGALEACLDEWGHADPTRASDCLGGSAQRFSFESVEIRGFGSKCLDLKNGSTTNATPIQAWECASDLVSPAYNANQRWDIVYQGNSRIEIRYAANPNKCVTVQNSATSDGTKLYLWDCVLPNAQGFRMLADGSIRYEYNGATKCLDTVGPNDAAFIAGEGGPANGAALQLWTCLSNQLNQKFNFTGQIRNLVDPSECLDRKWGGDANGVATWAWTCAENIPLWWNHAQVWDYYFKL